jgi:galactokinase
LKKTPYKIKELQEELNIEMKDLLCDIEYYESVITFGKEFSLHKRIYFLLREYQRVVKIYNTVMTLNREESFTIEYFNNIILPLIDESNKEMASQYECISEDMINFIKFMNKINSNCHVKVASKGWSGNIFAIELQDEIKKTGDLIIKHFESYENKGQEMANFWISDEINKYCYWSQMGGCLGILDPKYEDFMI